MTHSVEKNPPPALTSMQEEVNHFVDDLFSGHASEWPVDGKIIRDASLNYMWFHPHEIPVIDSPLLQRLRGIHQTALAYLVYPTARHSRFEHSLGVSILAGRMLESIDIYRNEIADHDKFQTDYYEVRLAGLLHDCGHALFSHLSESVMSYKFSSSLKSIRSANYFSKTKINMGELLSYLMVKSDQFKILWSNIQNHYSSVKDVDIDRVARLILGIADAEEQFKADIISGPFDADKMDYFARDALFTGIKVELDIERLLYTLTVLKDPSSPRRLIMKRGSVPHLEQIIFGKMMLYSSIYQHHKVRAIECAVKGMFEAIWDDPSAVSNDRLRFRSVGDFLRVSEMQFLVDGMKERRLADQIGDLMNRRLLKRSLVFNSSTIRRSSDTNAVDARMKFLGLSESANEQNIREIRSIIFESMDSDVQARASVSELWLDLPPSLPLSADAEQCQIEMSSDEPPVPLRSLFPSDEWVAAYADNKWTGHLFFVRDNVMRKHAGEVGVDVLSSLFPGLNVGAGAVFDH